METNNSRKNRKVYSVLSQNEQNHEVIKVLNIYPTYEEALQNMVDLVMENKTEEDLLSEFSEKEK